MENKDESGALQHSSHESSPTIHASDSTEIALAILDKAQWEQEGRCQKGRLYPFAFKIGEDQLNKLSVRVNDIINSLSTMDAEFQFFKGEVRYDDLSSEKFDDFTELLDRAGDQKDPESLVLLWRARLYEPAGTFIQVEVIFSTEKPLQTQELGLLEFHHASMELNVTGPDIKIVRNIFDEIDPFITASKIGGIYKPLLLFRNKIFVYFTSMWCGFLGQMLYLDILSLIRKEKVDAERTERVDEILKPSDLEGKFEEFVKEVFGPSDSGPILEPLLRTASSLVVLLIVVVVAAVLLPKFVPRSGINIGFSANRYTQYENVFRLVVFTILLSGVVLPVIVSAFF